MVVMRSLPRLFTLFVLTLPGASAAPTAPGPDAAVDARMAVVVRIEVAAASPNYFQPWQVGGQEHRRGSGFQISGRRILTNHHVIEDAVDIRISRGGEAKRWPARVVTAAPDVDLAIVEVIDADSFYAAGDSPAELSVALPSLQAPVSVLGFPSGGRTICVTEGIVSRVDVKNYRLGPTSDLAGGDHLVIQIDAAINSGNSGGPCFGADGRVVGVAFQGIDSAQNVGYVIPARVVSTFLENVAKGDGVYAGVQEVPYRSQQLESPALRERLGVPDNVSGVAVTFVSPISSVGRNESSGYGQPLLQRSEPLLQADDVITSIDGHRVGNDHTVALRGGEIVRADYLITSKAAGVPTTFEVLRRGKAGHITAVLTPLPPPIPRNHGFDSSPEWLLIGGFLFTPLTAALVESASVGGMPTSVHDVYQRAVVREHGFRSRLGTETVVLLDILSHDANFGYSHDGWRILTSLNGVSVRSLRHAHLLWRAAAAEPDRTRFIEFAFHDNTRYVLRTSAAMDAEALLLARHGIPTAASPGLEHGGRFVGGAADTGRYRRNARTLAIEANEEGHDRVVDTDQLPYGLSKWLLPERSLPGMHEARLAKTRRPTPAAAAAAAGGKGNESETPAVGTRSKRSRTVRARSLASSEQERPTNRPTAPSAS